MALPFRGAPRAVLLYLLGFLPLSLGGGVVEGVLRDERWRGVRAAAVDTAAGWLVFPAAGLLLTAPIVLVVLRLIASVVGRRYGTARARLVAALVAPVLVTGLGNVFGGTVLWAWSFPISSALATCALGAAIPDATTPTG